MELDQSSVDLVSMDLAVMGKYGRGPYAAVLFVRGSSFGGV